MGVDVYVSVEVENDDGGHLYWFEVCAMHVGRHYHWDNLQPDLLGGRYEGTFTFAQLKRRKDSPIFDGTVKDTDLYRIMHALAKKYGKRDVRATWEAS
jgi:hypothetical protein